MDIYVMRYMFKMSISKSAKESRLYFHDGFDEWNAQCFQKGDCTWL